MNTTTNTFILAEDGFVYKQPPAIPVNVTEDMLGSLVGKIIKSQRNVVHIEGYTSVGLCLTENTQYWSVRLKQLNLRCPFEALDPGEATPNFESKDPDMLAVWKIPDSIRIVMVVRVDENSDGVFVSPKSWLFAFSENGSHWRLPLANLFEDCALCLGRYNSISSCSFECLVKTLDQFEHSNWRQDGSLWNLNDGHLKSAKMFRFDATTDPWQTLPVNSSAWTNLCAKIGNTVALKYTIV